MKLRYWFRLTKAFLMRFKSVLFAGVIAGLLIFSAARFFTPYIFPSSVSYIGQSGRFHIDEIPYSSMWPDDIHWLPLFLDGKKFRGKFLFGEADSILSMNLEEVEEI